MTEDQARDEVINYWRHQAREALASARSELSAGRLQFAINRAYYACFYAASAVLLRDKQKFVKHKGVRAAVHKNLVKAGAPDESSQVPWPEQVFSAQPVSTHFPACRSQTWPGSQFESCSHCLPLVSSIRLQPAWPSNRKKTEKHPTVRISSPLRTGPSRLPSRHRSSVPPTPVIPAPRRRCR